MKKLELKVPTKSRAIDPLEIFQKLTLRRPIEQLWGTQTDALREWHAARDRADVIIQKNTGGGKTLVGLLIAQSLVNETKGHVLYVCPNNQLVEQTLAKANEISLLPAVKAAGQWQQREQYESGSTFCITNYAAVFHGHSPFIRHDTIDALVFDDAHVAEKAIRDAFSLRLPSDEPAFNKVMALVKKYMANTSLASKFQDIVEGRRSAGVLFVPSFVVWQIADVLRQTLLDEGIEGEDKTRYVWEHVRENLKSCALLADAGGIEITPPVIPISALPFFGQGCRRVFLTATLPSQAAFARTFGINAPHVVRPAGKAGDAQRLFLYMPGEDDDQQRLAAMRIAKQHKSCVISPSKAKAEEWHPPSKLFLTEHGQAEINRFAASRSKEMLGLFARYDGIDLPGDACRMLILDRLPVGESLIDRFVDESIRVETLRIAHTATRIVQAIGRIFRSNTDHGVVLLVGQQLQAFLRNSRNAAYLPKMLQQQLRLGDALREKIESGDVTVDELIDGVLTSEAGWNETYTSYIEEFEAEVVAPEEDWYTSLIHAEHKAYGLLWKGQYGQSADAYSLAADAARPHDPRLAAWFEHWQGLALMSAGARSDAFNSFLRAANERSELGRPRPDTDKVFTPPVAKASGPQAAAIAALQRGKKGTVARHVAFVQENLRHGTQTANAEEAVRLMGILLGLRSERPDKSVETGPDVLWQLDGFAAWGFDLKTNKAANGQYSKDEIGQCHNHAGWMKERFADDFKVAIIGRHLPVAMKANPDAALRVIELNAFEELFDRLKLLVDALDYVDKDNLEIGIQGWLEHHGLLWPTVAESLPSRLAEDLRGIDQSS